MSREDVDPLMSQVAVAARHKLLRKMPKKELLTSHVAIMERLSEEFACTGGVAWVAKAAVYVFH